MSIKLAPSDSYSSQEGKKKRPVMYALFGLSDSARDQADSMLKSDTQQSFDLTVERGDLATFGRPNEDLMVILNDTVQGMACVVVTREDLKHTWCLTEVMKNVGLNGLIVVLAYHSHLTDDRPVRNVNHIPMSTGLISQLLDLKRSVQQVHIYIGDPHYMQVINPTQGVHAVDLMSTVLEAVHAHVGADADIVYVFPDDGAHKRFELLSVLVKAPSIVCCKTKGKDKDGKQIMRTRITDVPDCISDGDKRVVFVIVDDIIRSGSTIIKAAEALRALHPDVPVYAAVTHADFVGTAVADVRSWVRDGHIARFFVSDSNPSSLEKLQGGDADAADAIQVVSIAGKLMEAVAGQMSNSERPSPRSMSGRSSNSSSRSNSSLRDRA
jgi:phosphoribosylpyrophosphate synthetase